MATEDCIFEYMYRDGGNYKTVGKLRLNGYDPSAEEVIRQCLESGSLFVAEQIGVPALCEENWEAVDDRLSDLDHAYHEFVRVRPMSAEESGLSVWGPLSAVQARMEAAARRWEVSLSPNFEL